MKFNFLFFSFVLFLVSCVSIQSVYDTNNLNSSSVRTKKNWYAFTPKSPKPYFYDFSFLLDAPAGKHGFIQSTVKGNLEFQDGTQVKFFGVNIVAKNCFPDKSVAREKALILSQMGINLVRLHHMDAPWANPSLINYADGDSKNFNLNALNKLDYLIAELEKKGIYIYLDFLVHRKFSTADGIKAVPLENGAKQSGKFDPDLIALEKEYAKKLLTHFNPYTKKKYIDDPAIIASEFINESSIFLGFGGYNVAPYYDKELEKLWTIFLKENNINKNLSRAKFKIHYETEKVYIDDVNRTDQEKKLSIAFYHKLGLKYANEMKQYLKKLGVKYLLTDSNFPPIINADVEISSLMDYSDFHTYWDHPKVWLIHNDWSRLAYAPMDNTPAVSSFDNFFSDSIKANVKNKPFFVTEFNACFPNQYRITGLPIISAYGSLQGFDGILFFDSGNLGEKGYELGRRLLEPFSLTGRPDAMDLLGIVSLIFTRQYISESKKDINVDFGGDYIFGNNSHNAFYDENKFLAFMQKATVSFDTNRSKTILPKINKKNFDEKSGIVKSDTDELLFDYNKGYITINAPKVQGAVGFIGNKTFSFKNFQFSIQNEHAVVLLVSLDNLPLSQSKKMMLTVLGKVENSNQKFDKQTKSLSNIGTLPILYESIIGNFSLKNISTNNVKIKSIYWDKNTEEKKIEAKREKSATSFFISNLYHTTHYLIEK